MKELDHYQRQTRMNIRNFFLVATRAELESAKETYLTEKDQFGADCIQELIDEYTRENSPN